MIVVCFPCQGLKSPFKYIGGFDNGISHVEARYPAILFKQQLTACVEKIFGLIRDNLKKELSPLLSLCIQVIFSFSQTWYTTIYAKIYQSCQPWWISLPMSFGSHDTFFMQGEVVDSKSVGCICYFSMKKWQMNFFFIIIPFSDCKLWLLNT